ncbi:MAG: hypothetical protein IT536_15370 [Hyphomicrobiales bacterium]|nr:hypothetical protein [Hyphomicrobiales bacterium]
MRTMLIVLFFLGAPNVAQAEYRAGVLLAGYAMGDEWAKQYLSGLADGISWSNVMFRTKSGPPSWRHHCPPDKLAVTDDQYAAIMRQRVRAHPDELKDFAANVLIKALADTFPCTKP